MNMVFILAVQVFIPVFSTSIAGFNNSQMHLIFINLNDNIKD